MSNSAFSPIGELFEQARLHYFFPDASFAIFDAEKVLYRYSCGNAQPSTWFDLASLTKLYTSTAILALAEAQAFKLIDTAAQLLAPILGEDTYPQLRQRLSSITVENLLTHTSGLLAWHPLYGQSQSFWPALQALLKNNPPIPGMVYSDFNFMILGEIVKASTKKELPTALQQQLAPLLSNYCAAYLPPHSSLATTLMQNNQIAISAYGNEIERDMCAHRGIVFNGFCPNNTPTIGMANDGNCRYYWGGISGHAGLFAPVDSLVALGQFYLNAPRQSLYHQALADTGNGRGLGFEVDDKYPEGCGHTGFTGTSLWISKNNQIGAAILTNRLAFSHRMAQDINSFRKEVHCQVLQLNKKAL